MHKLGIITLVLLLSGALSTFQVMVDVYMVSLGIIFSNFVFII